MTDKTPFNPSIFLCSRGWIGSIDENCVFNVDEVNQSVNGWPDMQYQTLGKTGLSGSRLVFGCGAALSAGQANDLLEPALESGINVFDVGYRITTRMRREPRALP